MVEVSERTVYQFISYPLSPAFAEKVIKVNWSIAALRHTMSGSDSTQQEIKLPEMISTERREIIYYTTPR